MDNGALQDVSNCSANIGGGESGKSPNHHHHHQSLPLPAQGHEKMLFDLQYFHAATSVAEKARSSSGTRQSTRHQHLSGHAVLLTRKQVSEQLHAFSHSMLTPSSHSHHYAPHLSASQLEFISQYYHYLEQSSPWYADQGACFDEKVFPPAPQQHSPSSHCNSQQTPPTPMKNSVEDNINQQLLLTFLHERTKRSWQHSSDSLSYKSLSQTATFLKDYYAPTEMLMKKKRQEKSSKPSRRRTTSSQPPSTASANTRQRTPTSDTDKSARSAVSPIPPTSSTLPSGQSSPEEKRPKTTEGARSKSHSQRKLLRASTATGRNRKPASQSSIPSTDSVPTTNQPPSQKTNPDLVAASIHPRKRKPTISFEPERINLPEVQQQDAESPSPISLLEDSSQVDPAAPKIPAQYSDPEINDQSEDTASSDINAIFSIKSSGKRSDRNSRSVSDDDSSSTDASLPQRSSGRRSKLPLSEAEIGKIRRHTEQKSSKNESKSKSKKKKDSKKGSKSSKKNETNSLKSKKRKKRHESATSKESSKGVEQSKTEKKAKTSKSKAQKKSALNSASSSIHQEGAQNPIGLTIDSIVLPRGVGGMSNSNPHSAAPPAAPGIAAAPSKTVTIDLENSPDHSSVSSLDEFAMDTKRDSADEFFSKVDRLIQEISEQRSSNKKALIDLLHLIESRHNQTKLVKYGPLLDFLREKVDASDNVIQLFAARCLLKLSFSKVNRERLLEAGFMKLLVNLLSTLVNSPADSAYPLKRSKIPAFSSKANNKLIREILKSIHLFCKLGDKTQDIIENSQLIECSVRLIKHEELKSQKIALRCLCSAIQIKNPSPERYNALLYQICKLGAIEPLFAMLKNAANNVQKDALQTLCLLSENESARDIIYNLGVFHSFLWLMRSENEDIQEYALCALSHFVPSDNVHIDSVVLKYGLDLLVQFFIDSFNKNIVRASTKILAHMSEYARIHIMLLQPAVLKQTFSLLLDDDNSSLKSTMFGAHVILSNLSKFKEGQNEIYRLGGVSIILKSLGQIALLVSRDQFPASSHNNDGAYPDKDNMSDAERQLLPKVITRTIANLSGSAECQTKITNDHTLDNLIDLANYTGERTVIWNALCCISNLCDQPHNQRRIILKKSVTDCLFKYLTQKEDEKLLSRAIRCVAILSKNVHIQSDLEKLFDLKTIVTISSEVLHSEIQLDALRYLANLSHNYEFHSSIVEEGALKIVVKLSYFPLPIFHVEVARCFYNLSQNAKCRPYLVEEGAVSSLMRLKSETKHEKVRRYSENALKKF
mmetsp:Transcript_1671/g.5841  ORF Transcript_1671/g.5841 Transcript_1671/m.5841 type:complete len:1280 (-) Transcript_1671:3081-6920(-)